MIVRTNRGSNSYTRLQIGEVKEVDGGEIKTFLQFEIALPFDGVASNAAVRFNWWLPRHAHRVRINYLKVYILGNTKLYNAR